MSLDMSSSSSGRRTDLLFPIRNNSNSNSNGSATPPSHTSTSPSSSPFPPILTPSSLSSQLHSYSHPSHSQKTPTPFSTSESASSLVSVDSNSSSLYPASSLYTPHLSPSSSSNSVGDISTAVDFSSSTSSFPSTSASTVTDASSLFSSPPPLPLQRREKQEQNDKTIEFDLARRSSRPLPLSLKTSSQGSDDNNTNGRPSRFSPRTSSLSTLPNIATITTVNNIVANDRRSHSLASNGVASSSPAPVAHIHSVTASARTSAYSIASSVAPIRRKPLASSAVVPVSVSRPPSPPVAKDESDHESDNNEDDLLDQYDQYSQYGEDHQDEHQQSDKFAFDLENDLDIDIDDFLPRPDQRFTRSGSVDSPTLYEFPKTAALFAGASTTTVGIPLSRSTTPTATPSSLSKSVHSRDDSQSSEETVEPANEEVIEEHQVELVEDDKESVDDKESPAQQRTATDFRESQEIQEAEIHETDVLSVYSESVGTSRTESRNSGSTPAAPQTGPTTVSSQHEQALTTATLGSSDQILTEQPFYESENSDSAESQSTKSAESTEETNEAHQQPESPVPSPSPVQDNITQRTSIMSLFTRKTSPPHLSLGSISNTNPNNTNNNTNSPTDKEDNAQRSVSPDQNNNVHTEINDNRNSLYSVYDDEELQDTNIPIALPTISTSTVNKPSPKIVTQNSSETITTIVTANAAADNDSPNTLKPNNKSPSSAFKLGNFFGWPSASPSTTEFSNQSYSPLPSPSSLQPPPSTTFTHASTLSTPGTNSPSTQQDGFTGTKNRNLLGIISPLKTKTHSHSDEASTSSSAYYEDYLHNLQTPPIITPTGVRLTTNTSASPSSSLTQQFGQIEEMEDELKAISAELAASIRREMDLEDLVDRLQTEVNNPQPTGSKRTSDYFSDSGAISSKFGDYDAAKEEIAQVQRRAEQEKAQIRLELTDKLTDERSRRRVLDQQIKELSERASGLDIDARNNNDASGRVKQLESTCEDLRRRLSEERGVKENFEDLLAAMKTELQNASNERDNLRDEVVPQLRARVEGLESQATEHARQIYETTKMQQELQSLKDENSGLRSAAAFNASAENSAPASAGLSRSNTVKGMSAPPSNAANNNTGESREALAERLKDVEAQRDALHSALKSLLERQEFQNRENDKKIRVLELERQRLLTASPKKAGYERDVAGLRDEVSVLRRRAEEALEQKWQVEKGLSGLKMDLDRAEEEIAHLRSLLQQHDILLPAASESSSSRSGSNSNTSSVYDTDGTAATSLNSIRSAPVTSASLELAYKKLQKSYADALDRIRKLEDGTSGIPSDEKTKLALERLERSLSSTMAERDAARDEVATHLTRLASTAGSEKSLIESERTLATQLDASARRVEELAQQVRTQLETNSKLRDRLQQMVARGESDQQAHKARITSLESRLRSLEDQLVATQTAAEDRVARHEEQVAALKEAHNTQLQRLRDASGGIRASSPNRSPVTSPRMLSSSQFGGLGTLGAMGPGSIKSPMSPMFSVNGKLVPPPAGGSSSRPSSRGSVMSGASAQAQAQAAEEQQAQVATLKVRVSELETALSKADSEMQEVVGRMNTAQIEVMQLQEELETAGRETRRLQRLLEQEKVKGFEERFKNLSRTATA